MRYHYMTIWMATNKSQIIPGVDNVQSLCKVVWQFSEILNMYLGLDSREIKECVYAKICKQIFIAP